MHQTQKSFEITDNVLEQVNRYTVEPLEAKDIYCFSLTLCDNDIDRDCERFSLSALKELAVMFCGKSGIFDHDPKGMNQTARIFDTAVAKVEGRLTLDGQPYYALTAKAYMVRTAANADLIKEIAGGIKKEVSVSCSVAKQLCSICGADRAKSACAHVKGKRYGEKLCFVTLSEPTDAYEWSFVAVPAQPKAGVTKHYESRREDQRIVSKLKAELGESNRRLSAAAEFVKGEILRLSYFCKPFYTAQEVAAMTEEMDMNRLIELHKQLSKRISRHSRELDEEERSFITQPQPQEENDEYTI